MIGIFGGTFDPVHYGHLRSAVEVKEIFALDEVRLIPSAQPPHRNTPQASAALRTEMLRLATQIDSGLIVDTREVERQGASFMIDTLVSLRHDYPQQSLLLIIGSDAFNQLTSWHKWQQLFDVAHIVVLTRPSSIIQQLENYFADKLTNNKEALSEQLAGKLYFQPVTQLDISASKIREMIANDRNPAFLLPDSVIELIKKYLLYQPQSPT